jgi:cysteinyl-tRNA synthetase
MTLKIYNTLTRKKENFKPVTKKELKIYVCGVTVYDDVHIGHALSYIYYDILINYFKHFHNYDIFYVRNITDVGHLTEDDLEEDKIEKRAKERKYHHPMELVQKYTRNMWEAFDKLKLTRPNVEPLASAHIIEMQSWIKKMLNNGFAYEVNGNVYYDISKFKDYGVFSKKNIEELEKNTRFTNDPDKRHASDFALWIKANDNHILKWDSPWSVGYPGWHLECSTMGCKYLGENFDIHGGGIEHVFPHHQNEIAQNFGYYQHKVVNYWVHTSMLMVEGKKMGKSLGNFITIKDFLKDNSAENLRYLVTTGHYRKPQNYTKKAVEDAENTIKKLNAFIKRLQNVDNTSESKLAEPIIENTIFNFSKAMDDDLNTPMALSEIHFLVKEINKLIEKNSITTQQAKRILEFLIKVNLVFKFLSFKSQEDDSCKKPQTPREEILNLIEKRKKLRKEKKWEEADQIRVKLSQKGIVLYDNKDETTWTQE